MTTPTVPHQFYTALAARDWQAVGRLYADDARFDDPAFVGLDAAQVRAMWRMLLTRAGDDFRVSYEVLADTPEAAQVRWTAHYTFSQTGRPVVNVITAQMSLRDGRIVRHLDTFDFFRWSRQALGLPGWLLGWTGFLRGKVQAQVRRTLAAFMQKHPT
jgi:ketosteroid isomerase-like protein